MAEFVLVAGAWLGSWARDDVVPELRAAGHGAHPLTPSGLADRRGVAAGQRTHVRDVVEPVERNDLREVVPVGPEPNERVAGLPAGGRWRLVTMDTGHWPIPRPGKLARILLGAAR